MEPSNSRNQLRNRTQQNTLNGAKSHRAVMESPTPIETKIQQRRKRVNTIFIGQQEVMELQGKAQPKLNSARNHKIDSAELLNSRAAGHKSKRVSSFEQDLYSKKVPQSAKEYNRKSKSKKRVQFIIEETQENDSVTATVMSLRDQE